MLEDYALRNLGKTLKFLHSVGIDGSTKITLPAHIVMAKTFQDSGDYKSAYRHLLCDLSRHYRNSVVICGCCCHLANFYRNYSLLASQKWVVKKLGGIHSQNNLLPGVRNNMNVYRHAQAPSDAFLSFIEAAANGDVLMLQELIQDLPLFWEAFILAAVLSKRFMEVSGPLAGYFYMHLKVEYNIDHINREINVSKYTKVGLGDLPYSIEVENANLLAAFLNAHGHKEESYILFEGLVDQYVRSYMGSEKTRFTHESWLNTEKQSENILNSLRKRRTDKKIELEQRAYENLDQIYLKKGKVFDRNSLFRFCSFEYIEDFIFSLYHNDGDRLRTLYWILEEEHKYSYEYLIAKGCESLSWDHAEPVPAKCFQKAINTRETAYLQIMLGSSYWYRRDSDDLRKECFARAIALRPNDLRVYYVLAYEYWEREELPEALYCANRVLELEPYEDIWKLKGKIYTKLEKLEEAIVCFKNAYMLGSKDGLLHIAEAYKTLNDEENHIFYCLEYLKTGTYNKKRIAGYLKTFYQKKGEKVKHKFYAELEKNCTD
ncbi:hypothetical protein ENBRE01_0604 [Enteropsectra breve]|nr:hypothetical protein ENBRE01_0604 [Enteropsectra breve]